MCLGQPGGFGAKQERVAVPVGNVVVVRGGLGGEREDARSVQRGKAGLYIWVDLHVREVVVVQARALEVLVVEVEAEGLDQVQDGTSIGAQSDRVAGVAGDDWVIKDDVKCAHTDSLGWGA